MKITSNKIQKAYYKLPDGSVKELPKVGTIEMTPVKSDDSNSSKTFKPWTVDFEVGTLVKKCQWCSGKGKLKSIYEIGKYIRCKYCNGKGVK